MTYIKIINNLLKEKLNIDKYEIENINDDFKINYGLELYVRRISFISLIHYLPIYYVCLYSFLHTLLKHGSFFTVAGVVKVFDF